MDKFYDEYKQRITVIDEYMKSRIKEFEDCESVLFDAMNYAVFNGGKRIRSILCIETARMLTGSIERALPFASAIEFIHAFSLVHDDLPCMDNADTRRGQPSCHKKYGEAMALLAGDALLNTAFEIMTETGMINGQVRDLELMSSNDASEEKLIALIEQKTMALMMTSVECGALVSEVKEDVMKELMEFAYNLGIAFQIRDDFEDEEEDMAEAQNSPNFINTLGRDKAKEKLVSYSDRAKEIISGYPNNEFIKGLLDFLF